MRTVEVFADVSCPFTHVGLRRFVEERAAAGVEDPVLVVRAWPLELVNGRPLDPDFVAEEIEEIRAAVAPGLFAGFTPGAMPATSLPAMGLAGAAYRHSPRVGEAVSLELRAMLFESGLDISDPDVLARLAADHGLEVTAADERSPQLDHDEGVRRGVQGSPHWFTPGGAFFCPALDIGRDAAGHLHVELDSEAFERFLRAALGPQI